MKVGLLSCVITAAAVYVALEWRHNPDHLRPDNVATDNSSLATARDLGQDEKDNIAVYQKYSAGVVNITSTSLRYDFFLHPAPLESGTGSGAVLDKSGHIVTNYHVIEDASQLQVTLADHTKHPAQIVGIDAANDLAVLKVEVNETQLVPIPVSSSGTLLVGQKVLAIGNPYGLERTLSIGIISSLGRSIETPDGGILEDVIQTDAAINPGNSGGPLLNSKGELIGLNTAILSPGNSGNIGIGFAIPAETIRRVSGDLITLGRVRRPYLGVQSLALSRFPGLSTALGVNTDTGVLVVGIEPDSPAATAGIRGPSAEVSVGNYRLPPGGDVLLAVEGHQVDSGQHLSAAMDRYKPGARVTLTLLRNNRKLDVAVVLEEKPNR